MSTVQILDTPAARLAPAHSALLVIDMQNDFCAEDGYVETVVKLNVASCRAVAEPIMDLVAKARAASVPVIWVKANYEHAALPPGILAKQRERSATVCCAPGTSGFDFYKVAPVAGETIIEKHSYSAFRGTELESLLRARGIRTVAIAGVQTNVCVETTLRDAVCVGFYAALVTDCVASHTPALHEATLKNVQFLFGDVLDRHAVGKIWQDTTAKRN